MQFVGRMSHADGTLSLTGELILNDVTESFTAVVDAENGWTQTDYELQWRDGLKRIVDGNIVWAPALEGAVVLTTRGGDFELNVGQDVSIGYLSHTESEVRLYLQETFVFRVLTGEAAVVLSPSQKPS